MYQCDNIWALYANKHINNKSIVHAKIGLHN